MPTPKEVIQDLKRRIEAIEANRREETTRITLDLIARVRLRVQTTGRDYQNKQFAPYTPPYATNRAKAGYQVSYVDFTRTGRLWASIGIVGEIQESDRIELTVGSRTARGENVLRGARRKRGNIILPSDDEVAITAQENLQRLRKYLAL